MMSQGSQASNGVMGLVDYGRGSVTVNSYKRTGIFSVIRMLRAETRAL